VIRWLLLFSTVLVLAAAGCGLSRVAQQKKIFADHLQWIGLAAETFKADHGKPCWETPVVGKSGLSWRAELLPYLEQDNVYMTLREDTNQFTIRLFAPDGTPTPDVHRARRSLKVSVFAYSFSNPPGTAPFRRVVKADRPDAFVVVETSDFVPWGKPGDDLVVEDGKPLPKMGGNFPGGFLGLCTDGKVRWIPASLSEAEVIAALFDGEGGKEP
jgi:hypothetical protein